MSRLALNPDLDTTREFGLISRAVHRRNPNMSEDSVYVRVYKSLVYVWKIAEKRGDVFDRYGDDLIIAVHRWELDDICDGMADAFSEAEHWFRWEPASDRGDTLRLVGWLRHRTPGYGADIMAGKSEDGEAAETIRRLESRVQEQDARLQELESATETRKRASAARRERRERVNSEVRPARTTGRQIADMARTLSGQHDNMTT